MMARNVRGEEEDAEIERRQQTCKLPLKVTKITAPFTATTTSTKRAMRAKQSFIRAC